MTLFLCQGNRLEKLHTCHIHAHRCFFAVYWYQQAKQTIYSTCYQKSICPLLFASHTFLYGSKISKQWSLFCVSYYFQNNLVLQNGKLKSICTMEINRYLHRQKRIAWVTLKKVWSENGFIAELGDLWPTFSCSSAALDKPCSSKETEV